MRLSREKIVRISHQITDLLTQASFNGLHDVAPAPTGDFDFAADFRKLGGAGKCVAGGIDATAFVSLQPQALEDYVARLLSEVSPGTGFLASCGDTVPFGTPVENLRAVVRALERHGRQHLSGGLAKTSSSTS